GHRPKRTMNNPAAIIVPCYNEARRLRQSEFLRLLNEDASVSLLFVDDGSSDDTLEVLHALARQTPGRVHVLPQAVNQGKAEAVRIGLRYALSQLFDAEDD